MKYSGADLEAFRKSFAPQAKTQVETRLALEKIVELELKYKDKGRLVVRASGTEPRVRVMIEGPDQREMDRDVYALSKLIEHELRG